ncbi:unnamed protein product [Caenorhabditis angaria]|uniref:Uncharacterized protein n=1 Tax=Caenorhabditis angaria TaxID=860376 RepID=A0A9P1J544_9PELO|nr:unnamed protein product [Caenorhabditis angaria]
MEKWFKANIQQERQCAADISGSEKDDSKITGFPRTPAPEWLEVLRHHLRACKSRLHPNRPRRKLAGGAKVQ